MYIVYAGSWEIPNTLRKNIYVFQTNAQYIRYCHCLMEVMLCWCFAIRNGNLATFYICVCSPGPPTLIPHRTVGVASRHRLNMLFRTYCTKPKLRVASSDIKDRFRCDTKVVSHSPRRTSTYTNKLKPNPANIDADSAVLSVNLSIFRVCHGKFDWHSRWVCVLFGNDHISIYTMAKPHAVK